MMKPAITDTSFGTITVGSDLIEHDIVIRLSGQVKKRRKKLSKAVYGTSHTISLDEARHVYEEGAQRLIVGAGQQGMVELSDEATTYFEKKGCKVDLWPTPKAIERWNEAQGAVIGLFHITC
ncbi:MAG: Mth938-like domain-containing protein [Phycisphaerales bacterium]|nr:MAG: Mth938-like domain-containing protein [Phycisphaerales bacterium]